jgi:hypothetical protein
VNFDLKRLLIPVIALAMLAVIGLQTARALQESGAWRKAGPTTAGRVDPYAALEGEIASRGRGAPIEALRDPFSYGRAPQELTPRARRTTTTLGPPPPPRRPVVTAILQGDNDPRALLQYGDRDYTVKPGDLFADFRVISIAPDQVVLARGGERLILKRPTKGD